MPFMPSFPRSFTELSVREHAPALSGVYGISNASEWVYIGVSDNIREALLKHLQETSTLLVTRRPTGFSYETCDRAGRLARQDQLVLEYEPFCNRHAQGIPNH
jgi:hypothetical protein